MQIICISGTQHSSFCFGNASFRYKLTKLKRGQYFLSIYETLHKALFILHKSSCLFFMFETINIEILSFMPGHSGVHFIQIETIDKIFGSLQEPLLFVVNSWLFLPIFLV